MLARAGRAEEPLREPDDEAVSAYRHDGQCWPKDESEEKESEQFPAFFLFCSYFLHLRRRIHFALKFKSKRTPSFGLNQILKN